MSTGRGRRRGKACTCSAIERIVADNDHTKGTTAQRIVAMVEGRCNACGGVRPDEREYWAHRAPRLTEGGH